MPRRKRRKTARKTRRVRKNPTRGFTAKLKRLKLATQIFGRKVALSFNDIEKYIEKEIGRGYLDKRQITKLRRLKQKLAVTYPHLLSIYRLLKGT